MPKKTFIICDSESTIDGQAADIAFIVCDKQGNVLASIAALVSGVFDDPENSPLFYREGKDEIWAKRNLPRRYAAYGKMLENGSRVMMGVPAINRWLAKVNATYRPVLTAYNLTFDENVMTRTGIDHTIFQKRFCLWAASAQKWGHSRAYRQMVLDTLAFNPPTSKGNMSYQTKAEPMARFVLGDANFPKEPHTAYEDALEYELPILVALVKNTPPKEYMNPKSCNWQDYQVKDHFKVA